LNWFLKLPFFKKTVLTVANISIHYSNFKCTVFIDYIPLKYKLFKLIGKKLLRQHHKEKIIRKHILPKYYVPVRQKIRKKYIQKGKQKRGGRILGYKIRNKTWTFYKNPNIEETPFVMESMLKIEEFLESFAKFEYLYYCYYFYRIKFLYLSILKTYIKTYFEKLVQYNLQCNTFEFLLKKNPRGRSTAMSILNVIRMKLSVGHTMDQLIRSLTIELDKAIANGVLKGYKLRIAGRYKRATRTSLYYKSKGKVSSSTFGLPLDYAFTVFKGRYGVTGAKVWLNHVLIK